MPMLRTMLVRGPTVDSSTSPSGAGIAPSPSGRGDLRLPSLLVTDAVLVDEGANVLVLFLEHTEELPRAEVGVAEHAVGGVLLERGLLGGLLDDVGELGDDVVRR